MVSALTFSLLTLPILAVLATLKDPGLAWLWAHTSPFTGLPQLIMHGHPLTHYLLNLHLLPNSSESRPSIIPSLLSLLLGWFRASHIQCLCKSAFNPLLPAPNPRALLW